MSQIEKSALQESHRPTDGGFGFLDAFDGGWKDFMKEFHKANCELVLNSRPADDVLPKCEIQNDAKGEFILFSSALADKKQQESLAEFDGWLDGKTRLRPQAA